jgi:hypothetical protein
MPGPPGRVVDGDVGVDVVGRVVAVDRGRTAVVLVVPVPAEEPPPPVGAVVSGDGSGEPAAELDPPFSASRAGPFLLCGD